MARTPLRLLSALCLARCACASALPAAVRVEVSEAPLNGFVIPADFVGLSQETNEAPIFLGLSPSPPNNPFAQLMRNLRAASGGGPGPQLRIGGNSADSSVWWRPAQPLPPNQSYAITPADIASYAAALPLWNGSVVIDTSMYLINNASWAAAHIAGVAAGLGWARVAGVEIGNEVECYHDGYMRPQSWSYSSYIKEFEQHVAAVSAAGMPAGRIQGAVFCCNNTEYDSALPEYTAHYAQAGVLASVSYHRYALHGCGSDHGTLTMDALLSDAAIDSVAAKVAPFAAAARAAGIPFRIGEGNSVSCGGQKNVSDVFGVALWALDALLASAAVGVSTFNFHGGPHAAYSPITMLALPSIVPEVRPLYYGMLVMAELAAHDSVLLRTGTTTSNALVKAWALRDSMGSFKAVLIHKDAHASAPAAVTVIPPHAPGAAPASLARLLTTSPLGVLSPWNVTWRGQTFDGSVDGNAIGKPVTEDVHATAGAYSFSLPPGSAAVLQWSA